MTPEELRALKSGDLIWVDVQPHPNGKVYGYVPMLVVRTEIDEARKEIRVYFGQGSSIASLKLGCGYKFRAVDDLDALATFVRVNPDCLKVSTSSDLVPVLI